jgi:hypothetical protein
LAGWRGLGAGRGGCSSATRASCRSSRSGIRSWRRRSGRWSGPGTRWWRWIPGPPPISRRRSWTRGSWPTATSMWGSWGSGGGRRCERIRPARTRRWSSIPPPSWVCRGWCSCWLRPSTWWCRGRSTWTPSSGTGRRRSGPASTHQGSPARWSPAPRIWNCCCFRHWVSWPSWWPALTALPEMVVSTLLGTTVRCEGRCSRSRRRGRGMWHGRG